MTRFTLLATAATLLTVPALAEQHVPTDEEQAMGDGAATETAETGPGDDNVLPIRGPYASGTMRSDQLENMIRTSNIVGGDVFAVDGDDAWTEEEWAALDFVEERGPGWEDIGNVTDVVLSPDGRQMGLIVSHGGFLDIADDTVLLTMDDVRRIGSVDALDGDFNYVVRMTEDEIEQMDEVAENWF